MATKKALILGAGAVGLTLGHVLSKNGRQRITYLVRDNKAAALRGSTQLLYSYDTKKLVSFSEFDVLTLGDLESQLETFKEFQLAIVALHGDILQSEDGQKIIANLSKALDPCCDFFVVSPSFLLYDAVFKPHGILKKRVVFGLPNFLAHEVPMEGQPRDELFPERSQASIAFHFLQGAKKPLLVESSSFTGLFKESGVKTLASFLSRAKVSYVALPHSLLECFTPLILSTYLLLELQNYPKVLSLSNPSMKAATKAMNQIFSFYGALGFILKLTVGKRTIKLIEKFNRKAASPLGIEFIEYHHGQKVKTQNVQVFKNYVAEGKKRGLKVNNIEAFVNLCENVKQQ